MKNTKKIKAVIFDMDGTLIDTEKLLCRFWIEAAKFYGYNLLWEQALNLRSYSYKYAIPYLQGLFGEEFDYYLVRSKRIKLMSDYIAEHGIEKKPGVDKLVDHLHENGILAAIATTTDFKRTEKYLKIIGEEGRFDKIICGDMIQNNKPAGDIYIKAAADLNLDPKECLALEDSPNGIKSAYAAGCLAVMIPDLSQPDEEISPMLYGCCESLEDVIGLIEI